MQFLATLVLGLGLGAVLGWLWAGRSGAVLRAERDAVKAERDRFETDFKAAIVDVEAALAERNALNAQVAGLTDRKSVV